MHPAKTNVNTSLLHWNVPLINLPLKLYRHLPHLYVSIYRLRVCVCVFFVRVCVTAHTPTPCWNAFFFSVKSSAHPTVKIFPANIKGASHFHFNGWKGREAIPAFSHVDTHTLTSPQLCLWLKRCSNEKKSQLKHFRDSCLIVLVSFVSSVGHECLEWKFIWNTQKCACQIPTQTCWLQYPENEQQEKKKPKNNSSLQVSINVTCCCLLPYFVQQRRARPGFQRDSCLPRKRKQESSGLIKEVWLAYEESWQAVRV